MTLLVQKKDALVFLYLQTVRYICICQKFENRLVDKDKDLLEPFLKGGWTVIPKTLI